MSASSRVRRTRACCAVAAGACSVSEAAAALADPNPAVVDVLCDVASGVMSALQGMEAMEALPRVLVLQARNGRLFYPQPIHNGFGCPVAVPGVRWPLADRHALVRALMADREAGLFEETDEVRLPDGSLALPAADAVLVQSC